MALLSSPNHTRRASAEGFFLYPQLYYRSLVRLGVSWWGEEEAELMKGDFGSSVSPTPATQKLLLVRAKLGAEESGHPTAHNQPSKQRRTRVCGSWGAGGPFPNL